MTRIATVVALVVVAAACSRFVSCGRKHSPKKEPIARLPATMIPGSAVVSDDVTQYAYVVEDTKGVRMMRNGSPGESFRSVTNRSYIPHTHRHVYWARGYDDRPVLIVDDDTVQIGFSKHEYVVFDPTGEHWAALASMPDAQPGVMILRDGQVLGPFADASVPAWSPTATLAYLRVPEQPIMTRHTELVVGDKVVRSHTGSSPACVPAVGEAFEGPELPREMMVRYLTDGRLISLMPAEDHWALRRDDDVLSTFDASAPIAPAAAGPYQLAGADECARGSIIGVDSITTAEQAPVVAWWERPAKQSFWRVMVDGRPVLSPPCLRPWPHQEPLLGGENGRMVAFPCSVHFDEKGEAIKIVHGLRQYGPYPEVWALGLSDDAKHLAYGASNGALDLGWAVYVDGQLRSEQYYAIWRPRFDPSGQHVAWEAMRSPDGPNVLVLDGRALTTFDDLLRGPIFDRPGEVSWIVRRRQRLARLNFPLTP